jgi:6-phosphogluconolactonase
MTGEPADAAIEFHAHADEADWIAAACADIARALASALQSRPRARLLASGGGTPAPVYRALAALPLPWSRIDVGLVDERWLPPNDPDSNARLVYDSLLQGHAASAHFEPLVRVGDDLARSLAAANAHSPRPADVAVLGMGEDGHVASLFPGTEDLARAGNDTRDYVAMDATGSSGAGRWPRRITATPAALARAGTRILLLRGAAKRAVLERALSGADPFELPVRLLFAPAATPLRAHWTA